MEEQNKDRMELIELKRSLLGGVCCLLITSFFLSIMIHCLLKNEETEESLKIFLLIISILVLWLFSLWLFIFSLNKIKKIENDQETKIIISLNEMFFHKKRPKYRSWSLFFLLVVILLLDSKTPVFEETKFQILPKKHLFNSQKSK